MDKEEKIILWIGSFAISVMMFIGFFFIGWAKYRSEWIAHISSGQLYLVFVISPFLATPIVSFALHSMLIINDK